MNTLVFIEGKAFNKGERHGGKERSQKGLSGL